MIARVLLVIFSSIFVQSILYVNASTSKTISNRSVSSNGNATVDKINNLVNAHLVNANWLSAFEGNSFDVIVSNPPYVDRNDKRLQGDGVSFEPTEALISEEKGLKDIRHIIQTSKSYLRDSGCLLVEHAPEQSKNVVNLFKEYSNSSIRLFQDLNGDDRVSFGKIT